MQVKHMHWMGLISSILLLAVLPLSLQTPWWQLSIGDVGSVNVSGVNTTVRIFDLTVMIPIVTALNVSCCLLLAISAVVMMIYAVQPTRAYSKRLLCWAYPKPVVILIVFVGGLIALTQLLPGIINQYAPVDVTLPLMGTAVIDVPSELLDAGSGVQIGIAVSGTFHWTFYLAIAAAVLCIATRITYGHPSSPAMPLTNAGAPSSPGVVVDASSQVGETAHAEAEHPLEP
jgi:hypothetical protein